MEHVTDIRSNYNDQLANVARIIGRSRRKRGVFLAIFRGKKRSKTIPEICVATNLSEVAVLQCGASLETAGIVTKEGRAYTKDPFYAHHYRKILKLIDDPRKLKNFPTKVTPAIRAGRIRIEFPKSAAKAHHVTVDDLDSFKMVKKTPAVRMRTKLYEAKVKGALCKILGESGNFKDWGGEKCDLLTTKLRINGKRRATAIAFKGKGTSGILTLDKMGKRADQIIRLFENHADIYLVVYQGQIGPIVLEQMKALAIAKSLAGQTVYYGIIDGDDIDRLAAAYPHAFR